MYFFDMVSCGIESSLFHSKSKYYDALVKNSLSSLLACIPASSRIQKTVSNRKVDVIIISFAMENAVNLEVRLVKFYIEDHGVH